MAVPPNVPTSFVPRQSFAPGAARAGFDFGGAFAFFSYGVLFFTVVVAIGVFAYGRFLSSHLAAKTEELEQMQADIDPATVESFVRLRNRLTSGRQLLENHIAFSGFLDLIEKMSASNVRIQSMDLRMTSPKMATVAITGTAKNFNALAAESTSLSGDTLIQDAIFSGIRVNNTGTVDFSFSGVIHPDLIIFGASPAPEPVAPPAAEEPAEETQTP